MSIQINEFDLDDYTPWSGAVSTWDKIKEADMVDDFECYLNELYCEGVPSITTINDILWFEGDEVLSYLGLLEEEDEDYNDDDEDDEDDEETAGDWWSLTFCNGIVAVKEFVYMDEDDASNQDVVDEVISEKLKDSVYVKDTDSEIFKEDYEPYPDTYVLNSDGTKALIHGGTLQFHKWNEKEEMLEWISKHTDENG